MYTLDQEKRGLCPYDDKRYLLSNLPDGSPNPNTHAYGHKDLAEEEQFVADMPATPGTDLIIEHQERRFIQNHGRVVKKLRAMTQAEGVEEQPVELEVEIPNNLDKWEQAAREAAAQPGVAGRLTDAINHIVAAGGPIADPPQRAGPSGTYQPPPSPMPTRRDSSDDDENDIEAEVRNRQRPRNPFILEEAEEEVDDNDDGELDTYYNDYDFIEDDD